MLSLSCFRQRSDLNCAISLAKWIIHALNLEERVVNVVSSVLSVPVEDWTELVSKASASLKQETHTELILKKL